MEGTASGVGASARDEERQWSESDLGTAIPGRDWKRGVDDAELFELHEHNSMTSSRY